MTKNFKKPELAYEDPFLQYSQMIEKQIEEFYKDVGAEDAPLKVLRTLLVAMGNEAHVLIPVELPEEALRLFDPEKIQVGDTVTSDVDLHYRLIHLTNQEGEVCMPVFTSPEKMEEGGAGGCSTISFFMDEYMKQILDMQDVQGIMINPGGRSFFLDREVIKLILADHESNKMAPRTAGPGSVLKAPKDVPEGFGEMMREFFANHFSDVEKV